LHSNQTAPGDHSATARPQITPISKAKLMIVIPKLLLINLGGPDKKLKRVCEEIHGKSRHFQHARHILCTL